MWAVLPSRGGFLILSGRINSTPALAEGSHGVTVSTPGTGRYLLTLPGKGGIKVVSAVGTVEGASLYAHLSARTDSARTMEFTLKTDAGVATDLTSGHFLHFLVVVDQRT